jgi:hypothetical protein
LPGNNLVNTFLQQWIHPTTEELWGMSFSNDSLCFLALLISNGSVKMFSQQKKKIVGGILFHVIPAVSKESGRLVLPRTSCSVF